MRASKSFKNLDGKPSVRKDNNRKFKGTNSRPNGKRNHNFKPKSVHNPKVNTNPKFIDDYVNEGSRMSKVTNRIKVDNALFIESAKESKIVFKIYGVNKFKPTNELMNTKAFVKLYNFEGNFIMYDCNRKPHREKLSKHARYIKDIYEYADRNIIIMCSDGWSYYAEPYASVKQIDAFINSLKEKESKKESIVEENQHSENDSVEADADVKVSYTTEQE